MALLFNRKAYAYPGSYTSTDEEYTHNLAMMIMEPWVWAPGLNTVVNHQQYYPLTEFPASCHYHLSKNHNDFTAQLADITDRLDYLALSFISLIQREIVMTDIITAACSVIRWSIWNSLRNLRGAAINGFTNECRMVCFLG